MIILRPFDAFRPFSVHRAPTGGSAPDPCAHWILFTGTWADTGTWSDTCTWSDA